MITVTIVKIKMKKITLNMFIKLKKCMKIIPIFFANAKQKELKSLEDNNAYNLVKKNRLLAQRTVYGSFLLQLLKMIGV